MIKLTAQLIEVKTRPDGGIRITVECGGESLEGAQELMKLSIKGDTCLAMAIQPFDGDRGIDLDEMEIEL